VALSQIRTVEERSRRGGEYIGIEIESEEHAHHELKWPEVESEDRATPLGRTNRDVGLMYINQPATWLKSRWPGMYIQLLLGTSGMALTGANNGVCR
jgi:hypothetical protein